MEFPSGRKDLTDHGKSWAAILISRYLFVVPIRFRGVCPFKKRGGFKRMGNLGSIGSEFGSFFSALRSIYHAILYIYIYIFKRNPPFA